VLVWALAQVEGVQDWREHERLLERLLAHLRERVSLEAEAKRAVAAFERIHALLVALEHEANENRPALTSAGAWRKPCSNCPHEGLLPLDSCGFLLLLLSALFALPEARAQPRPLKNEVAFYIDTYGKVLPGQDPEVARAHRVFERVRAVADKSGFEHLSAQARQTLLQGWEAISFDWYKDKLHGSIYRRPEGGAEVLELDHFVQM
jgi:hypothetical protein